MLRCAAVPPKLSAALIRRPSHALLRWCTRALVVMLAAAGIGAGVGWAVASRQPQHYQALATFQVSQRPSATIFLSHSTQIQAEQTADVLRDSAVSASAVRSAPSSQNASGEWVAGPGNRELSFRVRADSAAVAERIAHTVYDNAGSNGRGLVSADQPQPRIKRLNSTAASTVYKPNWTVITGSMVVAAMCALCVFFLVRPPARPLFERPHRYSAEVAGPVTS